MRDQLIIILTEDVKFMRKVIVAINITLDGYCDDTAGIVDEALLMHFNQVMETLDTVIMGRVTYQLMEGHWPAVAEGKTGTKAEIQFAEELNRVDKIVVSKTLKEVSWEKSQIIGENIVEKINQLKEKGGKDIMIGGPSLISYLTEAGVIDEYYFTIHPVILGEGLQLFKNISEQVNLELISVNSLESGVISTHYRIKK